VYEVTGSEEVKVGRNGTLAYKCVECITKARDVVNVKSNQSLWRKTEKNWFGRRTGF
jgi:hypothetical protein